MHFHFNANDTQVFLNFQPSRFMDQDCFVKLQNCLSDINVWMHNHFLKLNIKTDVMEISLYPSLMPKVFTHCSLFLDDNIYLNFDSVKQVYLNFDTVKQVKNLGFIFDETLCLEPQINPSN